jgi:putative hydrolase
VDPLTALREIAFRLERVLAPTYRVRAFRNTAAVVASITPDELAERVQNGTLRELSSIGPATETVISQAFHGDVPDYLQRLRDENGVLVELDSDGQAVYDALRGDLHSHSDWSDGGSPIEEMAVSAVERGHAYLALTDHSPRLTVAHGLTADRLRQQLTVLSALRPRLGDFRLLSGIEVDILDDGTLDQEPELLDQLDVVVASVHSKLAMESAAMTRRMIAAVNNPWTNILGHCTGRMTGGRGRGQSSFDAEAVFSACAQAGVAVEINSRPERLDPPRDLLALAIDIGCLFSIDSDAHAPGQLDWQPYGCAKAAECGLPIDRIVNAWQVDDLLEWTRRRRGTQLTQPGSSPVATGRAGSAIHSLHDPG